MKATFYVQIAILDLVAPQGSVCSAQQYLFWIKLDKSFSMSSTVTHLLLEVDSEKPNSEGVPHLPWTLPVL